MKQALRKFLFSFIGEDSTGEIQPVYFWVTILMILVISTWIIKIFSHKFPISDTMFISVLGFIIGWLGLYNINKHFERNDKNKPGGTI